MIHSCFLSQAERHRSRRKEMYFQWKASIGPAAFRRRWHQPTRNGLSFDIRDMGSRTRLNHWLGLERSQADTVHGFAHIVMPHRTKTLRSDKCYRAALSASANARSARMLRR